MNALAEGQTARLYFELANSLKGTVLKTDVPPLQSAHVRGARRGVAVLSLSGGALPKVRRQSSSALGISPNRTERRRRGIDLDSCGVGRRGAHGACTRDRSARALSPSPVVFVDDDHRRPAGGEEEPHPARRYLLFPV